MSLKIFTVRIAWGGAAVCARFAGHIRSAETKVASCRDEIESLRSQQERRSSWDAEHDWPADMDSQVFYEPVPRGLEIKISDKLDELRRRNDEAKKKGS